MSQNKAFSLGGIGSPCCCSGGCSIQICVTACGSNPSTGVTIAIPSLSLSAVTGSSGCVTFTIPSAGTYTVTTSGNARYANTSGSHNLVCTSITTIPLTAASGYSCSGCFAGPIPNTLNYTFDGISGSFTLSGGTANFCVTKTGEDFISYPFTQCESVLTEDPCTTTTSAGAKFFADFSVACTLEQQVWCGSDCDNTDPFCTDVEATLYASSCADFVPNLSGICQCIWILTGDINHYGTTELRQQTLSIGTVPLPVPVNLTLTFSGGGGDCFPLFTTCDISE